MNHFCCCRPASAGDPSIAPDATDGALVLDLLAGDLPEPLAAARAQQQAGATFDLGTMRALHGFGREHT